MTDLHQLLKKYFGYDNFRPLQQEIIEAVLAGNDSLALLPTGGGKSVCYQIPALAQPGICLVISPLIALIKDQVQQLHRRNISALSIYSGMGFLEVKKALENATTGHFKFLYLSPERLQTRLFKEYLPAMPINLIAVDEAHCISQWGYDFRPSYLSIAEIREDIPHAPVLALTASATQDVQEDICNKLQFKTQLIFRQSFEKANLSFSIFNTPHKVSKLVEIINRVPGTALVYVRNRRRTKEIAQLLQMQGISASYYHAGLSNQERSQKQDDWINNKVRVMISTNAFGMGIDKPDVRTVVHVDIPDCIESYYQEAGRAGRDGKKAYAVLLYTEADLTALLELPEKKNPPVGDIKKVYQAVCDFLQIPAGNGEGQYYDFNLAIFCQNFKLEPTLVINALGILAQTGYVAFFENIFLQSKLEFTINKNNLHSFETANPTLEPIIKILLRSYEGIFDNSVTISEKTIAILLKKTEPETQQQLTQLHHFGVVRYQPQKDTPQLFFHYNRIPVSQVTIDADFYEKRKNKYLQKIKAIIGYAENEYNCRSGGLRKYFGDKNIKPCGICDTCLRQKKHSLSKEQMVQMELKTLAALHTGKTPAELKNILQINNTLLESILYTLASEEKIIWDSEGKIIKK